MLPNWRINSLWLVRGKKIGVQQVINITKAIHRCCKGKSVIIHVELNQGEKKITTFAQLLLRQLPYALFEDKRCSSGDITAMAYGNYPAGCYFSSCLGNTIYIKNDSSLALCPFAKEISLKQPLCGSKLEDLFDTESFKNTLIKHIHKREECKRQCTLYNVCHGGCPLIERGANCDIESAVRTKAEQRSPSDEHSQQISYLAGLYRG